MLRIEPVILLRSSLHLNLLALGIELGLHGVSTE